MTEAPRRIPTFVVTGFLGSGKTTLLRRTLQDPDFANTAVIVNEFGEVGLDHLLMEHAEERTIVMPGGCVCCSIRVDIETTLRDLFARLDSGALPPIDRLVIETTGLADPAPLLFTLHGSPLAAGRLRLASVIVTVDGLLGQDTLEHHAESVRQLAVADRIVITKRDRADAAAVADLAFRLRRGNPWATIEACDLLRDPPIALLEGERRPGAMQFNAGAADTPPGGPALEGWALGAFAGHRQGGAEPEPESPHRHDRIRACCLVEEGPVDWDGFGVWLTALLHCHGARILRVKGLLAVAGMPGPTVIHAVQHIVHPPLHLESWPGADRRSRLVFILQDIDRALLQRSLQAFARRGAVVEAGAGDYKSAAAGGTVGGRPVRRPTAPRWLKG
jgi:G3E family GTPase